MLFIDRKEQRACHTTIPFRQGKVSVVESSSLTGLLSEYAELEEQLADPAGDLRPRARRVDAQRQPHDGAGHEQIAGAIEADEAEGT